MFTGLIAQLGRIDRIEEREQGCRRLTVRCRFDALQMGESIAIDGACMTVATFDDESFSCDVMPESLKLTTLGRLGAGDDVHLERALAVGDRIGGHFVSGHIDGLATVRDVAAAGDDYRIRFDLPPELRRFVAQKGSITLAGVSLTVSAVDETGCEVALIPVTLAETTLGRLAAGDAVNVEVDLVARYLERLVSPQK